MSANYEFPKGWLKAYTNREGGKYIERFIPTFDPEAMEDWFKRCIEDYPYDHYQPDPDEWFLLWFSQFRNTKNDM